MTAPWDSWDHVLKVDPDKDLPNGETYEDVAQTGTDAIEIGGTLDVTADKTQRIIDACRKHDVPLYQEPSNPAVVVEDDALAGYLVPIVMNAGEVSWITGAHKEWVRMDDVDWTRTTTEAYVVLNSDASVAQLTDADCDQTAGDVAAYAEVAEQMFGQEIVYVEYSGMLGDTEKVGAAHDALDDATLFYGGGIHGYEDATEMAAHSDVIVVGDLLHDEGCAAVRETVRGARDA
ncbi:MAG: phosphoglycerol geranylgeranyltransferase [Halobacteriaceae archaeon]